MVEKTKKNLRWLWIGIGGIILVLVIFFLNDSYREDVASSQQKVVYNIIKAEDENGLLVFIYNCNNNNLNKEINCDGNVNYIGPNNRWVEAGIGMYCFKEFPDRQDCTVDFDSFKLGYMDINKNQMPFQLKCNYDNENNFKIKIGFGVGGILPQDCSSQGI